MRMADAEAEPSTRDRFLELARQYDRLAMRLDVALAS
jgi:hypothetical protein